jgi:hypothetical protein
MSTILYPALISSIVETAITHPIDVIKIHKQTYKPIKYDFAHLYSGFTRRALGNVPSRTIFLFSQDYFTKYFKNNNTIVNKKMQCIVIPFCTGFSQTLVDTPIEVLKMNKIMNIKNNSLFKGFLPHFGRNFIFVLSVYNCKNLNTDNNNKFKTAMYGTIGGMIGSYISHPLDTIKTCIQTNIDYRSYKFKDYFIGCNLRASMAVINMFISLYVFEIIKTY